MHCSSSLSSDSHAHKNRKKKKTNQQNRQHVPSRRVCYANDSVVSLTQEKQLLPLPLLRTGLKPSRRFAGTEVPAHHLESFGKSEAPKALCEQEQSPEPAMATLWRQQQQRAARNEKKQWLFMLAVASNSNGKFQL